jgi:hypothetical protein
LSIRHQARQRTSASVPQQLEVKLAILVAKEQGQPAITPLRNMMRNTGNDDSG